MPTIIRVQVGSMWIEVSGQTPHGAVAEAAFWSQVAAKCRDRKNLGMFCRTAKAKNGDVTYFGVVDFTDGAELTFHQYRDNSGFYVTRDDEFKVYQRRAEGEQPDAPSGYDQGDPGDDFSPSQYPRPQQPPQAEPEPEPPPRGNAAQPAQREYQMRPPAPARQPSQAPPRPPQTQGTPQRRWQ